MRRNVLQSGFSAIISDQFEDRSAVHRHSGRSDEQILDLDVLFFPSDRNIALHPLDCARTDRNATRLASLSRRGEDSAFDIDVAELHADSLRYPKAARVHQFDKCTIA